MSSRYPSRSYSSPRKSNKAPLVGFLLVASFGILFAGCKGPEAVEGDDLVFTQDDLARYRELTAESASGSMKDDEEISIDVSSGSGSADAVELDLSVVDTYNGLRTSMAGGDGYQVTNEFLNVRETPSTGAKSVVQLNFGDAVNVTEFIDSQWAKVSLAGGQTGYVSHRYISKVTSDDKLEGEKKQFENMYYVSFGFVNMRKEADQSSEKIGEIPGGKIIKPINIDKGWAKVSYDGKDGYVSTSYLAQFMPNFVVRQDSYDLPVLRYNITKDQEAQLLQALGQHVNALKGAGYTFMTMAQFRDQLLAQQQRDVRLEGKNVIVAVTGVTPGNIKNVSDALTTNGIKATLFIETQHVGISGITEKTMLTMMANGFDIQSATHTGDDLRALTDSRVELELKQSRKLLEDYTNKPVFAVAYPQGGVNDRVAKIAGEAGYLLGLGDDADASFSRSQFLRIPAMTIFASMSADEVTRFVAGGEE